MTLKVKQRCLTELMYSCTLLGGLQKPPDPSLDITASLNYLA